METVKAIFRGEVVELTYGIVFRIAETGKCKFALISTVDGRYEYRFWLQKEGNQFGARHKVFALRGKPYPVIRERANFDVTVGDIVLFSPPDDKRSATVFPVVNLATYQAAADKHKKLEPGFKPTAAPSKKRDHRWVE